MMTRLTQKQGLGALSEVLGAVAPGAASDAPLEEGRGAGLTRHPRGWPPKSAQISFSGSWPAQDKYVAGEVLSSYPCQLSGRKPTRWFAAELRKDASGRISSTEPSRQLSRTASPTTTRAGSSGL